MVNPSQSSFHVSVVVLMVSFMIIIDDSFLDQRDKYGY